MAALPGLLGPPQSAPSQRPQAGPQGGQPQEAMAILSRLPPQVLQALVMQVMQQMGGGQGGQAPGGPQPMGGAQQPNGMGMLGN